MITIHHLEVKLDIEGEGDEAVFARYFNKYANLFQRRLEEAKARARLADAHRSLGDRPAGEN